LEDCFEKRLEELNSVLLKQKYKPKIVKEAFNRARKIPSTETIKKVETKRNTGKLMIVIPFDSHLPRISRITQNHFNHMKRDPLCEIF